MRTFYSDCVKYDPFVSAFVLIAVSSLIELLDSYYFSGVVNPFLFDRDEIISGELWRIVSGHVDHLGWKHLLLNSLFLIMLSLLFSSLLKKGRLLVVWFSSSVLVSVLMLAFSPKLEWYVGLSASMYGLLVFALFLDREYPGWLRILVMVMLVVKLALEQLGMTEDSIESFIDGPVAIDSHVYGAISGVVIAFSYCLLAKWQSDRENCS